MSRTPTSPPSGHDDESDRRPTPEDSNSKPGSASAAKGTGRAKGTGEVKGTGEKKTADGTKDTEPAKSTKGAKGTGAAKWADKVSADRAAKPTDGVKGTADTTAASQVNGTGTAKSTNEAPAAQSPEGGRASASATPDATARPAADSPNAADTDTASGTDDLGGEADVPVKPGAPPTNSAPDSTEATAQYPRFSPEAAAAASAAGADSGAATKQAADPYASPDTPSTTPGVQAPTPGTQPQRPGTQPPVSGAADGASTAADSASSPAGSPYPGQPSPQPGQPYAQQNQPAAQQGSPYPNQGSPYPGQPSPQPGLPYAQQGSPYPGQSHLGAPRPSSRYTAPLSQGATWRAILLPPGIALAAGIVVAIILAAIAGSMSDLDSFTEYTGMSTDKIGYALPFVLLALALFGSAAVRFEFQSDGFAAASGDIILSGAPLIITAVVLGTLWWFTRWSELRSPSPNRGSTWIRIGISALAFTAVLFVLQLIFAARYSLMEGSQGATLEFSAVTPRSFFLPLLVVIAVSMWGRIAGHFKGTEAVGARFLRWVVPAALVAWIHLIVMVAIMSVVALFVLPLGLDLPGQLVPLTFVNMGLVLTLLVHLGGLTASMTGVFGMESGGFSETLTIFSDDVPGQLWLGLIAVVLAVLAASLVATVTRRPYWTAQGPDPRQWSTAWRIPLAFAVVWGLLSVLALPLRAAVQGSAQATEVFGGMGAAEAGIGVLAWSFLIFALWGGLIEVVSRTLGPRLALTMPGVAKFLAGRAIHPHWGHALGMSEPRYPLIHPDAVAGGSTPPPPPPVAPGYAAPGGDAGAPGQSGAASPGTAGTSSPAGHSGSVAPSDSAGSAGPVASAGYVGSAGGPGSGGSNPGDAQSAAPTTSASGSQPAGESPAHPIAGSSPGRPTVGQDASAPYSSAPYTAAAGPYTTGNAASASSQQPTAQQWNSSAAPPSVPPAGYPAAPPAKPFNRRKATLVGVISGAAVLVLVAGLIVVTQVNGGMFGPEATVEKYLQRLADGDTEGALEIADVDVPAEQRQLLTNDILGGAKALPTDISVADADVADDQALVSATFDLGGSKSTTEFSLVKSGKTAVFFDEWTLQSPELAPLTVDTPGLSTVKVNGIDVDTTDSALSLPAFPALYTVGLAEKSDLVSADPIEARTFFGGSVEDQDLDGGDPALLAPEPTDAFRSEVDKQVKTLVDSCAKKTVAQPDGCPFGSYSAESFDATDLKWSISSYPTVTVSDPSSDPYYYDGGMGAGPNGGPSWAITTVSEGEALVTGSYDSFFDDGGAFDDTVIFSVDGVAEIVDGKVVITISDGYDF